MSTRLYRRQFLLTPHSIDSPAEWTSTPVRGGRMLHTHPDLSVSQRTLDSLELTLVGYAIDPHHPDRDDVEILDALLKETTQASGVLQRIDTWGGRWILIAADPSISLLIGDASGLRQAIHTAREDGVWCASDAALLGSVLNLTDDPVAVESFAESDYFRRARQGWWPGDRTRYLGVRHLLPNHVLNLDSGEASRFWPSATLEARTLASGVQRGSAILKGMVAGAVQRFPLDVALTAGLDSRLLLAACREVVDRVRFHTFIHYEIDNTSTDVVISQKLAQRFGLDHRVIECINLREFRYSVNPTVSDYRSLYMSNTSNSHLGWGAISYTLERMIPADRVLVKANCNEVTRHRFRVRSGDETSNPETLSQTMTTLMGMGGVDFATCAFREWAEASVDAIEAYGYDAYDIAFWEQRVGRWQAGDQLERDLDHETFVPFNSREYFSVLLGVSSSYRKAPERLHREMIEFMWPNILTVPINPLPLRTRLRGAIRQALGATGTLNIAKRIWTKL